MNSRRAREAKLRDRRRPDERAMIYVTFYEQNTRLVSPTEHEYERVFYKCTLMSPLSH